MASWTVGDTTDEEHLRIDSDGYWELRYQGQIVESGDVVQMPWLPYSKSFEFKIRSDDPFSQAEAPVRRFALESPRANNRVTFYREEE